MRFHKFILYLSILLLSTISLTGQTTTDTTKATTKKGWSFGAVPAIAYDTDIGFKYGALVNFYDYGNGSIYPGYKHSIYLEWSRTTKGSGINQFTYDSKYLIPGIRTSGEISYLTEKGLDFYGFNGYKALFDNNFEDDSPENTANYQSRMFYKQDRRMLRVRADFMGKFIHDDFNWIAGIVHYNTKLDTIDRERLNEGKSDTEALPYVSGGLYGNYKTWNIIPKDQYYGGVSTLLKFGLVYDTRDNEPNPVKGMWTEALFYIAPGIFGQNDPAYAKFSVIHRQYFTILPKKLSLAYRIGYQGKLYNNTPSYMLPIVFSYGRFTDRDGLGGAKTLRGIRRNRVVGEDFAYGNFEVRWKVLQTVVLNQNLYVALSAFTDMGLVTREYNVNLSNVPASEMYYFSDEKEALHQSVGGGVHVALNENFIVAIDYGLALDKRDGDTGLYIGLNWLF
jgi:hypothetical protein